MGEIEAELLDEGVLEQLKDAFNVAAMQRDVGVGARRPQTRSTRTLPFWRMP